MKFIWVWPVSYTHLADQAKLAEYATIPSREGLLTMLAGGMMAIPRDLAIALDLYSQQKEEFKI